MKKFSKFLALGLALAMTFGMTVSAAEGAISPGDDAVDKEIEDAATEAAKEDAEIVKSTNASITAVDWEDYLDGYAAAKDSAETIINQAATRMPADKRVKPGAEPVVKYVVDVDVPTATAEELEKGVAVTLQFDGLKTDGSVLYMVYHKEKGGKEWYPLASSQSGNQITAIFHSFSPTMIIEVPIEIDPLSEEVKDTETNDPAKSPATGETLPVAGIMALICLAGVAVCVRKVNYNR